MNSEDLLSRMNREIMAEKILVPLGWLPHGAFRYEKDSKVYDLSDADLNQIDSIEENEYFVVWQIVH